MNILFVLHNTIDSNSGYHVKGLATELSRLGHDCVVATPHGRTEGESFRMIHFNEVVKQIKKRRLFKNRQDPEVIHLWTPRQLVRNLYNQISNLCSPLLLIHLEDNEESIARAFLGDETYEKALTDPKDDSFPVNLTHPLTFPKFIRKASGVTVLIDKLGECIPEGVPIQVIFPAADDSIFYPRTEIADLRKKYRISEDKTIIVYNGNTNPATQPEIMYLYKAVHLLNESGIPAMLIRTGRHDGFSDPEYNDYEARYAINLGFLEDRKELGELLSLADFLIQPGEVNQFNAQRFPCKLPEFFATGKPVILPKVNVGLQTRHLVDAYVVEGADGPAIRDAVRFLINDPGLTARLSDGARAFYEAHCSWEKSARNLGLFYESLGKSPLPPFQGASLQDKARYVIRGGMMPLSYISLRLKRMRSILGDMFYDLQKEVINFPIRCVKRVIEKIIKKLKSKRADLVLPGFNHKLYAAIHDVNPDTAIVHFIDSGLPRGEWFCPAITPRTKIPASALPPKAAIQWHVYYPDMVDPVVNILSNCESKPDLLISVPNKESAAKVSQSLEGKKIGNHIIKIIPNRGRDIGSLFTAFLEEYKSYEVLGHIHTKKSLHNKDREFITQWYDFLIGSMIGGTHPLMDLILRKMAEDPKLGLVYPNDPHLIGWGKNYAISTQIASRIGLPLPLPAHITFPAGTMFWARVDALKPILDLSLTWDEYPKEPLPDDGTMLHALERLIPLVVKNRGYDVNVSDIDSPYRNFFTTDVQILINYV
jgi:glycosyltransferase involved in cell wall biosynthesis